MSASAQLQNPRVTAVGAAIQRAARKLLDQQTPHGFWCADLTADTTLESDFILLQLWMYPPDAAGVWHARTTPLVQKAAGSILARQLPDGGFNIYPQGPAEISATVKAYCALKLAGISPGDPRMVSARECILARGGLQAANSYVKINLSLFDLYPRVFCPAILPELILLPGNFLYQMSSWSRVIVMSLALVLAHDPHRPVPRGFSLDELLLPGTGLAFPKGETFWSRRTLFFAIDRVLKLWEHYGPRWLRRHATRRAERWMLERFEGSDGLGAIYPPMMYAIMALDVLGYPEDHPARREAVRQFNHLMFDDGQRFFFQPCFSPIWDTAIAAYALGEAEHPASAELKRTADWILAREIRRKGDWAVKRPEAEPSGWAFEFANDHYPDIDDTAMVLLALKYAHATDPVRQRECHERAIAWLLAMQSADGGWAAFDADNNWQFLSDVPFADHNAMLDPTCADITGRVLEALAAHGVPPDHPAVRRGVAYLVRTQQADGSWYGRWGVAYIYGTSFALRGLRASGESDREAHVLRAGEWLRAIQNADGGWGESCASYDNDTFTAARSTPSQTAWAILGLIAGGDSTSRSLPHGIEYLLENQLPAGDWAEELATGTGFPTVFYLNYHLYRLYFPLLALAEFSKVLKSTSTERL